MKRHFLLVELLGTMANVGAGPSASAVARTAGSDAEQFAAHASSTRRVATVGVRDP